MTGGTNTSTGSNAGRSSPVPRGGWSSRSTRFRAPRTSADGYRQHLACPRPRPCHQADVCQKAFRRPRSQTQNPLPKMTTNHSDFRGSFPGNVDRSHLSRGISVAPALAGTPHLLKLVVHRQRVALRIAVLIFRETSKNPKKGTYQTADVVLLKMQPDP